MSTTTNSEAFDRVVEPVIRLLHPEQVEQLVNFHADAALQQRIEELARKANEGELTPEDLAEYEGYAQANRFIAVLQAQACRVAQSIRDT